MNSKQIRQIEEDLNQDDESTFEYNGVIYRLQYGSEFDYDYDVLSKDGEIIDGGTFDGDLHDTLDFMTYALESE